jgi:hypothetical protein
MENIKLKVIEYINTNQSLLISKKKITEETILDILPQEIIEKLDINDIVMRVKKYKLQLEKENYKISEINTFVKNYIINNIANSISESCLALSDKISELSSDKNYDISEVLELISEIKQFEEAGLTTKHTITETFKSFNLLDNTKETMVKIVLGILNQDNKYTDENEETLITTGKISKTNKLLEALSKLFYDKDIYHNVKYKMKSFVKRGRRPKREGGLLQLVVEDLFKYNLINNKHGIKLNKSGSTDSTEEVLNNIYKKMEEAYKSNELTEEDIEKMIGFSVKESDIEIRDDFLMNVLKYKEEEKLIEEENIIVEVPLEDHIKVEEELNSQIDFIFKTLVETLDMGKMRDYQVLEIKAWIMTYLKSDFLKDINNEDERYKLLRKTSRGTTLNIERLFEIINERSISFTKEEYKKGKELKTTKNRNNIFKTKTNKDGVKSYYFDARAGYQLDVLYISPYEEDEKIHSSIVTLDTQMKQEDTGVFINYFLKASYINKILKEEFGDEYSKLDAEDIRIRLIENDDFYQKFSLINNQRGLIKLYEELEKSGNTEKEDRIDTIKENVAELKNQGSSKVLQMFEMFQEKFKEDYENLHSDNVTEQQLEMIITPIKSKLYSNDLSSTDFKNLKQLIELYTEYVNYQILEIPGDFKSFGNYLEKMNKEINISFVGGKELINQSHPMEIQNIFKNQWVLKNKQFNSRYLGNSEDKMISLSEAEMIGLLNKIEVVFDNEITKGRKEYNVTHDSMDDNEEMIHNLLYGEELNSKILDKLIKNFYLDEDNFNSFIDRVSKTRGGLISIMHYKGLREKVISGNYDKLELFLSSINSLETGIKINDSLRQLFVKTLDEVVKKNGIEDINISRLQKIFIGLELHTVESICREILSTKVSKKASIGKI